MNSETIVMCVVALLLGMLLANMLKSVCGCKTVEGQGDDLNHTCTCSLVPGTACTKDDTLSCQRYSRDECNSSLSSPSGIPCETAAGF